MKPNLCLENKFFENFFITATFFEAKPILNKKDFQKVQRNLFCNEKDILLISGIGKKNILKNKELIQSISSKNTLNIGFAGAVKGCELFDSLKISSCIGEKTLLNNNTDLSFQSPLLISVENPIENPDLFLNQYPILNSFHSVLVDMEAFWIYQLKKNLTILKTVSDNGSENFKQNFLKNKDILENKLSLLLNNNFF